ncbi:MAG: MarR family transcriptional regulator [Candidatus Sericytochromatia bacterium]|nr:MarR family transcriptional regulator [Candidatus Sericytochromatia bacterium]
MAGCELMIGVVVEQCPCFSLGVAHRRSLRLYDEALLSLGLTVAQAHVIFALYAQDGLSARALAMELQVDAASLTPMLGRLEKRGLLRRCPDPGDRRAVRICLEERAHRLRPSLEEALGRAARRVSDLFTEDEYRILMTLLNRLGPSASADQ